MSPLDTGSVVHTLRLVDPVGERAEPAIQDFPNVGAYLKAVRERRGRSLADLAKATRIRASYLAAIEDADYSVLPSRPFAIGYVRAYANALELDGEACAERYRSEAPGGAEPLRAPIGVNSDQPERRPLYLGLAALLVGAVVVWNIVQRTSGVENDAPPPAPAAPAIDEPAPAPTGPITLGAPTPPPPESTRPAPYVTPGLNGPEPTNGLASLNGRPAAAPSSAVAINAPIHFEPKGEVYGAPAGGPAVLLQARKPAALIIRGPNKEVYFARQLKEGEAYRAPLGRSLSAEVTDPAGFSIYINGQLRGALLVNQTPLDKVATEIVAHAPTE